jgi:hypothetical protein
MLLLRGPAAINRDRHSGCVVGNRIGEQTIICPISSGCDMRRSPPSSAAHAAICGSMIAVSVQPGQMQFAVTPPLARLAALLVTTLNASLEPFDPEYCK